MIIRLLLIAAISLAACTSSKTKQYLDMPSDLQVLPVVIACPDGSAGYVAFVADNTPYGGKIKMLDGCAGGVNEDFDDGTKGTGKGILVGPMVNSFDLMVTGDGLVLAAAIPDERRLALVHLNSAFERTGEDVAAKIGMIPRVVHRTGEFFLALGDDLIEDQAFLVAPDGTYYPQTLDKHYDLIACDGERCLARSRDDGSVSSLTVPASDAGPVLSFSSDLPGEVAALFPVTGLASLDAGRFLVWNDGEAVVLDVNDMTVSARIPLPADTRLTAATAVSYVASRPYDVMDEEETSSRAVVYLESSDEDAFIVEEETPDADVPGDMDGTDDTLVFVRSGALAEAADDDAIASGSDARNADPVWLAFDFGRILSYDLASQGWMYVPVAEDESVLPQVIDAGVTLPEEGATTVENRPRISYISAVRGLATDISYEFVYEELFSGSFSDGGEWHEADSLFTDPLASFDRFITGEPHRYAILFMAPPSSDKCLLPAGFALSLDVRAVVDAHTLRVDAGKWHEEIADCYEGQISYGVYPKDAYLARATLPDGGVVESCAREMPADWGLSPSREVSYHDRYIDLVIRRRTDDVMTSRGLSFAFTLVPSTTFFAPATADLIDRIAPLPNGHVLLFAPLRRTLYEYSPVFEETITNYR